jgi:hypothetical protein
MHQRLCWFDSFLLSCFDDVAVASHAGRWLRITVSDGTLQYRSPLQPRHHPPRHLQACPSFKASGPVMQIKFASAVAFSHHCKTTCHCQTNAHFQALQTVASVTRQQEPPDVSGLLSTLPATPQQPHPTFRRMLNNLTTNQQTMVPCWTLCEYKQEAVIAQTVNAGPDSPFTLRSLCLRVSVLCLDGNLSYCFLSSKIPERPRQEPGQQRAGQP